MELQIETQKMISKGLAKPMLTDGDSQVSPQVFDYNDYRKFLSDSFLYKRSKNPSFTESAFCRKSGLGANSRGYFKLIVSGKRNLTPHTLRGFAEALGLDSKETLFFESLVYLNQARTPKDKQYYFGRLAVSAEGKESEQFLLYKLHYDYYSNWYVVAVRELVGLAHFEENPTWIAIQLRNKINKKQASEALGILERLELIRRNQSGRYEQVDPLVKFPGGEFHFTIQKFQSEMLDRAKECLESDPYEDRYVSSVTLSCDYAKLGDLKREVDTFRDKITTRFGVGSSKPDTVFQLGIELFQLTPIHKTGDKK